MEAEAAGIVSQVEGLRLWATLHEDDIKAINDPLEWAVGFFPRDDSRAVELVDRSDHAASVAEGGVPTRSPAGFDSETGAFTLERLLLPEQGVGVRVRVKAQPQHFLGMESLAKGDALRLLLLLVLAAAQWGALVMLRPVPVTVPSSSDSVPMPEKKISEHILPEQLLGELRGQVFALGGRIRDLVARARDMTVESARAKPTIDKLAAQEGAARAAIAEISGTGRDLSRQAELAEIEALNLLVEIQSGEATPESVAAAVEKVQSLTQGIREFVRDAQRQIATIDVSTTPLRTDLAEVRKTLEGVLAHGREMDRAITETTKNLMVQAQLVQRLSKRDTTQ